MQIRSHMSNNHIIRIIIYTPHLSDIYNRHTPGRKGRKKKRRRRGERRKRRKKGDEDEEYDKEE